MKTYIIPIFIPHYGCRNACIFCNQHKITGVHTTVTADFVERQLEDHLKRTPQSHRAEAAFYGGSFTALPVSVQNQLLEPAYSYLARGKIHAIRVSTRPDCIDEAILQNLIARGVRTVEIGAQSFDPSVLEYASRGHTEKDIQTAAFLIRKAGLHLGIQLMPGLPRDTWRSMTRSLMKTVEIRPDFVRIYPTLVLKDTRLAELYMKRQYAPMALDEAVRVCALMKLTFQQNGIRVIRTGLQATEQLDGGGALLAGPYHPAFGELADAYIYRVLIAGLLEKIETRNRAVSIAHSPRDASKIRGNQNANTAFWHRTYRPRSIAFRDASMIEGQVELECEHQRYLIDARFSTFA